MKSSSSFLIAVISISITGCWNNAGSDPHELPPPPSTSRTGGRPLVLCDKSWNFNRGASSNEYCTSEIRFDASAQSFGNGTDVYVSVHSFFHGGDFMVLREGDALQASIGSESQPLEMESLTNPEIHYTAHFETNDPGLVTIAFTRTVPNEPGGLGTVQVAPPFAVSNFPDRFTYGDDLHFSIDPPPASGSIFAYIDGPCITTEHDLGEETAVPVFGDSVSLSSTDMILPRGECDVTVHARVETTGSWGVVFDPGSAFVGLQERGFTSAMTL